MLVCLALVATVSRSSLVPELSLRQPYSSAFLDSAGWTTTGVALVADDRIILTGEAKGQRGAVWLLKPVRPRNWRIVIGFKIHGENSHMYADGMAFWYVQQHSRDGPVLGHDNPFNGLGILLDTYSNKGNNERFPRVSAQLNDGKTIYDESVDGETTEFAGCYYDFRKSSVNIIITYLGSESSLFVEFQNLETGKSQECFNYTGIELPQGYFMGITAATGDLYDAHELYHVDFENLDSNYRDKNIPPVQISQPRLNQPIQPKIIKDSKSHSKIWTFFYRLFVMVVLVGVVFVCMKVYQYITYQREKERRKRFY